MSFERTPTGNAAVDRNFQNVEIWSKEVEQTKQLPVRPVTSSAKENSYTVTPSDVYLPVNSRGGPMKIVFPAIKSNQAVRVLNAFQGSPVTLVQPNGQAFINAPAVITLAYNESALMVTAGNGWYRFE